MKFRLFVISLIFFSCGITFAEDFNSFDSGICRFNLQDYELPKQFERAIVFGVERIFDTYKDTFGFTYPDDFKVTVTIFSDKDKFHQYQTNQIGRVISESGYFAPKYRETVVIINENAEDMLAESKRMVGAVYHESSHMILMEQLPSCPTWLNEGLAEYFKGLNVIGENRRIYLDENQGKWLRYWTRKGFPITLEKYVSMSYDQWMTFRSRDTNAAYTVGYSLVYFLTSSQKTENVLKELLWDFKKNGKNANSLKTIDDSFPGGFERLEKLWLKWIPEARPYRPLHALRAEAQKNQNHSSVSSAADANDPNNCIFEIASSSDGPVIKKGDPGTENNKYGFEGGRALKLNGIYHLFTSEMIDDPWWTKMRLAHWKSPDGKNWQRVSTLYESSGDFTGTDQRAALWSPMPIFDPCENRWNLFYVSYKSKPNTETAWYLNHEGRIWRAISKQTGLDGLDGPYEDIGIILQPDLYSDKWEGLQGVDSFFPYKIADKWYAFYGSAQTQNWPCKFWGVGLAQSDSLAGPWKRCSVRNPVPIDPVWVENPIVTKLPDGTFIALLDGGPREGFAYSLSKDGLNWQKGVTIPLEPAVKKWWVKMRTPLGLIPEDDGTYTIFYTAMTGGFKDKERFACIAMVKLKLKKSAQ